MTPDTQLLKAGKFPELRDMAYHLCTERAVAAEFPFLFTEPQKAHLLKDWGAEQVGASNRLAPAELARCFNWSDTADAEVKLPRVAEAVELSVPIGR